MICFGDELIHALAVLLSRQMYVAITVNSPYSQIVPLKLRQFFN